MELQDRVHAGLHRVRGRPGQRLAVSVPGLQERRGSVTIADMNYHILRVAIAIGPLFNRNRKYRYFEDFFVLIMKIEGRI